MSGFAAIWNTDGAPVDERLLVKMQDFLSSRGPDEQQLVILGSKKNVGLVHTAFHTSPDSGREHQPCTIDGSGVWLIGDLRIDARQQLWKHLCDRNVGHELPVDARLVLHAYRTWQRDLVNRIIGNYSFVIWDERQERIFAVRDHLGTRPLFYARVGKSWILSNSIDCIRIHPGFSGNLDDIWISEFLRNKGTRHPEKTVYSEIKRLPAGHLLDVTTTGQSVVKYWQLEVGDPIYYKKQEDYLEHFRDLAKEVIRDRIRIGRIAVEMSGGLDSTSLVAFILQIAQDTPIDLVVVNHYFKALMDDKEPRFAAAAADHFGISIHYQKADNLIYDPQWWTRSTVPPEPHFVVFKQRPYLQFLQTGPYRDVRAIFFGHGVDECLRYGDLKPYLGWLIKRQRFTELGSAMFSTLQARGLSGAFSALRSALGFRKSAEFLEEKPAWLRDNWMDHSEYNMGRPHPWHPQAVAGLSNPDAPNLFQGYDPGIGGWNFEAMYPFLDLRMMQFLVSVPVVPWCYRKLLFRESMRGLLPELVLKREKTALPDYFVIETMRHPFPPIFKSAELDHYVDTSKVPTQWPTNVWQNRLVHRLLALQYWLAARHQRPTPSSIEENVMQPGPV